MQKMLRITRAFNDSEISNGVRSKIGQLVGSELAEFDKQLDEILSKHVSEFESMTTDLREHSLSNYEY